MIWDNDGDDTIDSGVGDDWLIAGRGEDSYDGDRGFDILAYVRADTGVNVDMRMDGGDFFIPELDPASFAFGDTITNIEGIVGSRFNDTIRGFADNRSSYINGFDGDDSILGGRGADVLKGGKGDDRINIINGERDTAFGGEGNDGFTIGGAADILGGAGRDSFVFIVPSFLGVAGRTLGEVVIHDFDNGGFDDQLVFQGTTESALDIDVDGRDIVINIDGVDGSIRLVDTDLLDLAGAVRF